MTLYSFVAGLALTASVMACPGHDNYQNGAVKTRATGGVSDWGYEASYNWGSVSSDYTTCQTGTQQSPISLKSSAGTAKTHKPTFDYPSNVTGSFFNWNYGPAFTLEQTGNTWTNNPALTFDNETVYLKGWHIHSPSDHLVDGEPVRAEMHFVHVDENGHERAVLGFLINPGTQENAFFSQLPGMIGFNETGVTEVASIDLQPALDSVSSFSQFWTYEGSLTSPPCTEGIRWFVAQEVMTTSVAQMKSILGASTYSARAVQKVWEHRVNQ